MASADLQLFNDVGLDGQVNEEAEEVMLDGPMVERGEMLDGASGVGMGQKAIPKRYVQGFSECCAKCMQIARLINKISKSAQLMIRRQRLPKIIIKSKASICIRNFSNRDRRTRQWPHNDVVRLGWLSGGECGKLEWPATVEMKWRRVRTN